VRAEPLALLDRSREVLLVWHNPPAAAESLPAATTPAVADNDGASNSAAHATTDDAATAPAEAAADE
jgi:hypothetical protein